VRREWAVDVRAKEDGWSNVTAIRKFRIGLMDSDCQEGKAEVNINTGI